MNHTLQLVAAVCAFIAIGLLSFRVFCLLQRRENLKRRKAEIGNVNSPSEVFASSGLSVTVLRLLKSYSYDHSIKGASDCLPSFRFMSKQLDGLRVLAGVSDSVTLEALLSFRMRSMAALLLSGGIMGLMISNQMAVLLAAAGLVMGFVIVPWALTQEHKARCSQMESSLSQLIEVLCLGLRSGLSFDFALDLYCRHFENAFSSTLNKTQHSWQTGLSNRNDALHGVAASYSSDPLSRVVDSIVRSLRFGSSMAQSLESIAVDVRQSHRASVEEKVMKAPVKMMLPVGMLILPSMLLLVLGPVLLELMEGF